MKDFKVAPVATEEELDQLIYEPPPENEDSLARYSIQNCITYYSIFIILYQ